MRRTLFALVLQHEEYFFLSFSASLTLPSASLYFSFFEWKTANHIAFFHSTNNKSSKNIPYFFLHASQPYVHVTNSAEACTAFRPSWYYIYQRILSIASSNNKKCSLLRIRLMQGCYCDICKKRIRYNSDISFSLSSNVPRVERLHTFRGTVASGIISFALRILLVVT